MSSFTINPAIPQPSQNPRLGADQMRAIAVAVAQFFGLSTFAPTSGTAPFSLDPTTGLVTLTGDPVAPLGAATLRSVDVKIVALAATGGAVSGAWVATGPATLSAYLTNAVYLVTFAATSAGFDTLNINGIGAFNLSRFNASQPLHAGDLVANATYVVLWTGTQFEVLTAGYMPVTGGVFEGFVTLAGDPTTALQAATKQYVDNFPAPLKAYATQTVLSNATIPANADTLVIADTITIPNDGYTYRLLVSWGAYADVPNDHTVLVFRLSDDGNVTRFGGAFAAQSENAFAAASGSRMSPTLYTANQSVTIGLYARASFQCTVPTELPLFAGSEPATWINLAAIRARD